VCPGKSIAASVPCGGQTGELTLWYCMSYVYPRYTSGILKCPSLPCLSASLLNSRTTPANRPV
jgi:hypothetical protein